MPLVSDAEVEKALAVLGDVNGEGAAARAAHEFESGRLKTVLAELILRAPEECKTQGLKEAWALSHSDYIAHLDHVREVAKLDYAQRNKRQAAQAFIDAWRTEKSNARAAGRIG